MSLIEKNKTFLIIRFSSFGDVLLSSHIPRSIKKAYPDSHIIFLVKKKFSIMLKDHPDIDKLIFFDSVKNILNQIKDIQFDSIFDLQHNPRSILMSLLLKKKQYFYYNKQSIKRFFYVNFKVGTYNLPYKTVIQRYSELLDNAGIPAYNEINYFGKSDLNNINLPGKYICISPGAAHLTKQWPVEYQIDLIEKIYKNTKYEVVLIGGETEVETAESILNVKKRCLNLVGKLSFLESSQVIKNADYIICNDSSVMHMARAHKKRGLVIFGSTTKRFGFYPDEENLEVLENISLHCRPCSHIGRKKCPKKHFRCMMDLNSEMAWNILEGKLRQV